MVENQFTHTYNGENAAERNESYWGWAHRTEAKSKIATEDSCSFSFCSLKLFETRYTDLFLPHISPISNDDDSQFDFASELNRYPLRAHKQKKNTMLYSSDHRPRKIWESYPQSNVIVVVLVADAINEYISFTQNRIFSYSKFHLLSQQKYLLFQFASTQTAWYVCCVYTFATGKLPAEWHSIEYATCIENWEFYLLFALNYYYWESRSAKISWQFLPLYICSFSWFEYLWCSKRKAWNIQTIPSTSFCCAQNAEQIEHFAQIFGCWIS